MKNTLYIFDQDITYNVIVLLKTMYSYILMYYCLTKVRAVFRWISASDATTPKQPLFPETI